MDSEASGLELKLDPVTQRSAPPHHATIPFHLKPHLWLCVVRSDTRIR
jgi:hypothetical protein